jgi:hypothetical protein
MKIHFGAASPLLKYSGVLTSTSTSLIEMTSVSLLELISDIIFILINL